MAWLFYPRNQRVKTSFSSRCIICFVSVGCLHIRSFTVKWILMVPPPLHSSLQSTKYMCLLKLPYQVINMCVLFSLTQTHIGPCTSSNTSSTRLFPRSRLDCRYWYVPYEWLDVERDVWVASTHPVNALIKLFSNIKLPPPSQIDQFGQVNVLNCVGWQLLVS